MKIVLLGYMGSGKSQVGIHLANTLETKLIDLDQQIEDRAGKSISDIFNTKGEIYFRKLENELLHEILEKSERVVLATGGGTPCYGDNLTYMQSKPDVKTVYLKTSIPELASRLSEEKAQRPLISHLSGKEELIEFIGKHLFERSPFYNQAELKIETDGKSVNEIVEAIVLNLF